MSLVSGSRVGPYEIVDLIGEGGMGQVYRARDTKLHRDVALKVIPAAVADDPDRLVRFRREAQVLASLNHPNIAQVYGLEDGALAMELVDGDDLSARIARGPMPIDAALAIARQLIEALDAAHERGIVHRDLKPANIKVRDDGTVKVLDFGLAKALSPDAAGPSGAADVLQNSPTITAPAVTEFGAILGTASYMSPEQARGLIVDRRTDVWAFGCVLYEMITATRAFTGDTVTDILSVIVHTEPDLSRVPEPVRGLLRACLQKDRRRRLRDIGDALLIIDGAAAASATTTPRTRRSLVMPALSGVMAIALGTLAVVHFSARPVASPMMRFDVPALDGQIGSFQFSPDGTMLLLAQQLPGGEAHLVLQSIATGAVRPVPGTDGVTGAFWSPDGRTIAFTSRGALKRISVAGGAPEVLASAGLGGPGCWGPDAIVVMGNGGGLWKVPLGGGEPSPITIVNAARGEIHHEQPACLPDGRFLYFRHLAAVGASGIYLGDARLPPEKQPLDPILVAADGPVFVTGSQGGEPDLLFMQDDTLFVQPFNVDRAEFVGQPARVAGPVGSTGGASWFSATAEGLLVYAAPVSFSRQLTWIGRDGTVGAQLGSPIRALRSLRISPAGTSAAVGMFPPDSNINNDDIWLMTLDGGPPGRFTSEDDVEVWPIWSPTGARVAYWMLHQGQFRLMSKAVAGGPANQIAVTPSMGFPSDWSSDSRFIVFTLKSDATQNDIWAVPADGGTPVALVRGPFNEEGGVLSPDAHWLAYVSNESGRTEVYVRPFIVSADGTPTSPETGVRRLSTGVRGLVRWRRDGHELLYMDNDGRLMAIEVSTSPSLTTGKPRPLFTFPDQYLRTFRTTVGIADIAPDASRVLVGMPPADSGRRALQVIVNWRSAVGRHP